MIFFLSVIFSGFFLMVKSDLISFMLFQSVSYTTTGISKTVYNPAAAAMAAAAAARAKAQASLSSPTAVKAADFVSKMEKVKQIDAMKKVCYNFDVCTCIFVETMFYG